MRAEADITLQFLVLRVFMVARHLILAVPLDFCVKDPSLKVSSHFLHVGCDPEPENLELSSQ